MASVNITGSDLAVTIEVDGQQTPVTPGQVISLPGGLSIQYDEGGVRVTQAAGAVSQTVSGNVAGSVTQIGNAGTLNF